MRFAWLHVISNVISTSPTENYNIQQRIGAEAIGTMHRYACSFAGGIQSRNNLVFAALINSKGFASVPRRDATHLSFLAMAKLPVKP